MRFLILFFFSFSFLQAQFAGPAGTEGSTAIFKDSSVFVGWATQCQYFPGWLDLADTSLGRNSGSDTCALGFPGETGVLSLGDAGIAILHFQNPIKNGNGPDFAVFENGFADNYLEYAFVEVSSDNVHFVRFPAVSYIQFQTQIGPFQYGGEATKINNLAGKYRNLYGTPFDLEELKDSAFLNVDSIISVKIIDVVGSISSNYASFDQFGNPINDPYPTPFSAGGFDLDAVGVIHAQTTDREEFTSLNLQLFPNPVATNQIVKLPDNQNIYSVFHVSGQFIGDFKNQISIQLSGLYFVKTIKNNQVFVSKLLVL